MRHAIICSLAAVLALAVSAPASADPLKAGTGNVRLFQYGDYYGGSGGGSGSAATPQNMRISIFFTAIPILSGRMYDSSSDDEWTKYWDLGLGGGLHFSYQMVPGLRMGVGSGYHTFLSKQVDVGIFTLQFDNLQCIPLTVDAVFCFPFNLPVASWFKGPGGFVEGPSPYIGIELGGVYRPGVKYKINSTTSTENYFEDCFTFAFGFNAGFEFRMQGFAFFIDFGYRYYTPPDKNDSISVNIKEMTAFPIKAGIVFYFGGKG